MTFEVGKAVGAQTLAISELKLDADVISEKGSFWRPEWTNRVVEICWNATIRPNQNNPSL